MHKLNVTSNPWIMDYEDDQLTDDLEGPECKKEKKEMGISHFLRFQC